jgi:hypothetical protein
MAGILHAETKVISEDRAEKALRYLAETDLPCAEAKADMERAEFKAKAVKQQTFLHSSGTVAERQATAEASEEHSAAQNDYFASIKVYSHMANKRETERIVLDCWRSIQANRRAGQ